MKRSLAALPLALAWALLFALAAPGQADAAAAVTSARNFSTLMGQVLGAAAAGFFAAALLIGGGGTALGSAGAARILKPGMILAVACGLANQVYAWATNNGQFLLGGG